RAAFRSHARAPTSPLDPPPRLREPLRLGPVRFDRGTRVTSAARATERNRASHTRRCAVDRDRDLPPARRTCCVARSARGPLQGWSTGAAPVCRALRELATRTRSLQGARRVLR